MDAAKTRALANLWKDDDASAMAKEAGAFERTALPPPYHVQKGSHPLDKQVAGEKGKRTRLAKYGFDGAQQTQAAGAEPVSNALPSADDIHTMFTMSGAIYPPYDPLVLTSLVEHSHALRPNIDAYKTNVDGFGFRLDPVIDLDAPDAVQQVGDAMYLDALRDAELQGRELAPYPDEAAIVSKIKELRSLMRLERAQVEQFFEHVAGLISFTELRRNTRDDLEGTGNAYWEVVRNAAGKVAEFHFLPSYSVRLAPLEHRHELVRVRRKTTPLRYENSQMRRRFRRYIQIVLDRIVYFKEFGDTRVISKRTGRVYPNLAALGENGNHDGPATEVIHFRVHTSRSPYGIPRWIGALLAVLGSRAAEEVNVLYFENKAVPPLAILVSGGKLAKGVEEKLATYIEDNIKGRQNFHKILVIEAEVAGGGPKNIASESGKCRIELVPLRDAQQDDALFQNYDAANTDKIGQSFRLPRILRGDTTDFNRATADAALESAEAQVFQGERGVFDDLVNRRVMPELGVRFWLFKSNSPVNRNPSDASEILSKIGALNALRPNELRDLIGDVVNKRYAPLPDGWAQQPAALTIAGIVPPGELAAAPEGQVPPTGKADGITPPKTLGAEGKDWERVITTLAGRVMSLREGLGEQASKGYRKQLAKAHEDETQIVLTVPHETFRSWFESAASDPPQG